MQQHPFSKDELVEITDKDWVEVLSKTFKMVY